VAVPLDWDEVDERLDTSRFGMNDAVRRSRERDPWAGWRRRARSLGRARRRLDAALADV
jgi:DNA primase